MKSRARTALGLIGALVAIGVVGWVLGAVFRLAAPTAEFDLPVVRAISDRISAWQAGSMRAATLLGSGWFAVPVALGAGTWWRVRRGRWDGALLLVAALAGATVLEFALKAAVARSRPAVEHLVDASGYAFPSGHALRATVLFGVLAVLAGRAAPAWRARAWAAATIAVFAVAASRVALGVHYPTDVFGGIALGACWLRVVVPALRPSVSRTR